jgi:replicative DNA helicase
MMASPPPARIVRNVEAEAVVLGSMLCDNRWTDRLADILTADDFSEPLHGRIFAVIVKEAAEGRSANAVTIAPYLRDDPGLAELGGVAYLFTLSTNTAVLIAAETAARQVKDMARRRLLIAGLGQAMAMAADMNASNEDVISAADAATLAVTGSSDGVVQVSAGKAFEQMMAAYDEPKTGVTCQSIIQLDDVLGPIRPHHLVITAGRPGMEKTAVALSYAIGAAAAGHGVLFVSLEMSRQELMQRATADLCYDGHNGIPYDQIRDGSFPDKAKRRVYEAGRAFADMPLHIVDAATLTIGRLNRIVRRHKRRLEASGQKLELVVVDYLQLLRPDGKTSSPYEAVSEVSRGLKMIAKMHDVGVMALAQLSRSVEQRENKRPMLSDLRDSGQIEQDADAVLFLYRDEYYLQKGRPSERDPGFGVWEDAMAHVAGQIEFIIAKRRNGPERTSVGRFSGIYQSVRSA